MEYTSLPAPPRKTGSIARSLAWSIQWRKLVRVILTPVFLAMAAIVGWCSAAEQITLGAIPWNTARYVQFTAEFPNGALNLVKSRLAGNDISTQLVYVVEQQEIPMGNFIFWLAVVVGAILLIGLLDWFGSYYGVVRRVRRYLKPIDDIAQATESISSRGFDESKFHSLETAIDELGGVSADEKLHIGDDDLAGLETAVNNLILRMHRGYRQQVRFVDDASHELRTPIAVIQGYADMLDRWGKTDPQVLEESIRAIRTETEHMKTLVEQLLFLARGDAGRHPLHMEKLDISALAEEVMEESRMIDSGHTYVLKAGESVFVRGDGAMLKQAVRILVENAAKYSPEDSRITLCACREGERACLAVQDNGIGVSPEDARRMFDRFYRADAARNSETGGSGLGLSIAKWIVGRHGGGFRVKSVEELGTRITIELPLLKE